MRCLIACEESGTVRSAFAAAGWDAWSCDLLPARDGSDRHFEGDLWDFLEQQPSQSWDLIIAHPPCDHLATSGAAWFAEKRADGRQQASIDFAKRLWGLECPRIAIENPVGILSSGIRHPDQIIQPWQFGDSATKATCLWLRNLPKLRPTKIVDRGAIGPKGHPAWMDEGPRRDRKKTRSKTFQGIAHAMAAQWGDLDLLPVQMTLDYWQQP